MKRPLEIHALVRAEDGTHEWHLNFDPKFPTSRYSRDEITTALVSMLKSIHSQPLIPEE
jgi:hypothetical protein